MKHVHILKVVDCDMIQKSHHRKTQKHAWLKSLGLAGVAFGVTAFVSISALETGEVSKLDDRAIKLQAHCPPSFELTDEGICELRSIYQLYPSLQDGGMGGLKRGIPLARDGFTPQEIDLGRYLFFDPILSKDGSISCASCHDPDKGFSDGLGMSVGISGDPVARSAPTLWNSAFLDKFFWDARATSYEEQMLGPLYDEHEMGNTPENLLTTINAIPEYRRLFKEVYDQEEITVDTIYNSLAAFQASLISLNSRYDQYAHGYHKALTDEEIKGMNVFRSFVSRCSECHTPPLFTNNEIAVIGTPEPSGMPRDVGAEILNGDPTVRAGFKVPTLRNIVKTAPYMHSGRFETLREAIEFYNKGRGHAVGKDEDLMIHWHVHEPDLKPEELDQLVAFMGALTDESFKPKTPTIVPSGLDINKK